jgi:hypothetical protein
LAAPLSYRVPGATTTGGGGTTGTGTTGTGTTGTGTTGTGSGSTTSTPPPVPPVIIGEQAVFKRKLNKKGKPTGKAVLTGFALEFSAPLSTATAKNPANYQLDSITTKKVGKKTKTILHPITRFTVSYVAGTDTVDLSLIGTQAFATGGQLTVVKGGVTGASDAALAGSTVFRISKKGTTIRPTTA